MIRAVQIQTIDACNSRCVMCPHKSIDHTGAAISDALFAHIVDQLAAGVERGLLRRRLEVNLFFLNEPLLDGMLFERAEQIRQRIPGARIVCFTNGLLLPKYKDRFPGSAFNQLQLSLYGFDAASFNRVTELSLNEDQLAGIVEAAEWIGEQGGTRVKIDNAWQQLGGETVLFPYSSRAGFYSGEILHRSISGCTWGRARHWLHFLVDGEMVLCCMDWRRETRFANIADWKLADLLESPAYQQLVARASGETDSAPDFICKRCEKARSSEPAMPEKTLIFTAASGAVESLVVEWIASLRTFGKYNGPVLVLDYGLTEELVRFLSACDVDVVRCQVAREADPKQSRFRPAVGGEAAIVNYRYLDAAPILRDRYQGHAIVHFDADIWFQSEVGELFRELSHLSGCLFAIELGVLPEDRWGPAEERIRSLNEAKVQRVIERHQGHINGGMMAGRYGPFMHKLEQLLAAYEGGWDRDTVGCDQYLLNVLLDEERDSVDGQVWNCSMRQVGRAADGTFRCLTPEAVRERTPPRADDPKVAGLHVLGLRKNEFRFLRFHEKVLERFIAGVFSQLGRSEDEARAFFAKVSARLTGGASASRRRRAEEGK